MTLKTKFIKPENKKYLFFVTIGMILTLLALYARYCLFPIVSGDYYYCLLPWYETLKENGGLAAVGMSIGDYTPMYFYILAILTYIPVSPIVAIKVVSCIADIILAFVGCKIVKEITKDATKTLVAYGILLFMPSVMLNSAAWAQCDAIYSLFILSSIYFLLKDRDWAAAICFSIAFSFKLQAIFFAPVLLVLLLRRKIRFRTVFALPAVYFISIIPAWIAGRTLYQLLTIYFRQAQEYKLLNMYIQNAWALVKDITSVELGNAGVFFAGGIVLISLFWICRGKFRFNKELIVVLSGFYTLLLPFFLPFMHERYYYLTTVITAIFAIINIKNLWMFLIMEFCLVQAEVHNLFGKEAINFNISVFMVLAVLLFYFRIIYAYINSPDNAILEVSETKDEIEVSCKS